MPGRDHRRGSPCGLTRRTLLRGGASVIAGAAALSSTATAQADPDFGGWFDKTENYAGIVDETGKSEVTVTVGAADVEGGPYAFVPAAVRVSPGTTITWEWTGEGGSHNVVASDGGFESELVSERGHAFSHTFESSGVYRYYCTPHKQMGMKGAVVVGDASVGGAEQGATRRQKGGADGGVGITLPGTGTERTLFLLLYGPLGLAAVLALWQEIAATPGLAGGVLSKAGYRLKRHNGFRNRLVGSVLVGWTTVLLVLSVLGGFAVGLWYVSGGGAAAFLVALLALGAVVVLYAASSVGVELAPGPTTETGGSGGRSATGGTGLPGSAIPARSRTTNGGASRRIGPVVRGWIGALALLVGVAGGTVALWRISGGGVIFLAGLFVVGLVVAWYAVDSFG